MKLSDHFTTDEFACHGMRCNCDYKKPYVIIKTVRKELLTFMEAVRAEIKRPLHVNCGLRCPQHNAEVGGEKDSQHLFGFAVDIKVPDGMSCQELAGVVLRLAKKYGYVCVGIYAKDGFLHIDIRGLWKNAAIRSQWQTLTDLILDDPDNKGGNDNGCRYFVNN